MVKIIVTIIVNDIKITINEHDYGHWPNAVGRHFILMVKSASM